MGINASELGISLPRSRKDRTPIKFAGEAPGDHWPVCRHAIRRRRKRGQREGDLILDREGKAQCYCRCKPLDKDGKPGRHHWDHDDSLGRGKCIWCEKPL